MKPAREPVKRRPSAPAVHLPGPIEMIDTAALVPYARNARTHSPAQVAQIAASIQEFGFTNPVLVDQDDGIIAGHGRVMAAQQLGLAEVPCIRLAHLSDAQKRAYILADNKLALNAGWDEAMLASELQALADEGFEMELIGFDDDEIEALLNEETTPGDDEEKLAEEDADDEVPEPPAIAVSRAGDVWALGPHRLICGDASNRIAIATLMQGKEANLCFTSPPYGNQRDYTSGGISDWDSLMRSVFAQLPMAHDGQVLVNLGLIHRQNEFIPYWDEWLAWMQEHNWRRFAWYVWDQGHGLPGDWSGRLAPSFEFVFHFNRVSRKANKIVPNLHAGEKLRQVGIRKADGKKITDNLPTIPVTAPFRVPDNVIRIRRHIGKIGHDIDHPAVFPIALPQFVIEAYTQKKGIVFEPFGGSGTTMLAAQRTGRVCRSVEIAPEYVDVAIKRFQQQFPDEPVTLESTGQTFDQVAAARA